MTSVSEFNCIFCKDTFEDKESLQIHFRKHGDPKYNQKRFLVTQNDTKMSNEKSDDQAEMVSCDVCPEVFTTISKAITHKHKVHPDHDAKYFCPWCGKLFTMKHLYNKHIQANHNGVEKSEEKCFHCDTCEVDFFVPMAMLYHNKFFHRQDTDMPSIGLSKKLRLYNQEAVQIYYCAFCGDEYENKVNLQKHISDDHSDENQSPDEVLRCPLCEAIFYHLDAYEIHLTFHSTDDLYNDKNEMRNEITEFSLETVAPITEIVENIEPKDAETSMNAMGIDQFLQLAMDESDDGTPKKSRKKKKHKKSKTHAITLDEFLNMNKDVFGEEIDFQGVEEVPTQVVAKRLKAIKKQPACVKKGSKFMTKTNLEKLKQQGIVVKKKSGVNSCINQNVNEGELLRGNSLKVAQNIISNKTIPDTKCHKESNILSTSNEMLSKLINQSNNQIKIVKKTFQDKNLAEDQQEKPVISSDKSPNFEETEKVNKDIMSIKTTNNELNKSDIKSSGETEDNNSILCNEFKIVSKHAEKNLSGESFTDKEEELANNDNIISNEVKPKGTIDSISSSKQGLDDSYCLRNVNNSVSKSIVPSENTDGNDKKSNLITCGKNDHGSDEDDFEENVMIDTKSKITDSNTESLSALKHLSHLITVKPLNQGNNTIVSNDSKFVGISNTDTNNIQPIKSELPTLNDNEITQNSRNSPKHTSTTKAIDALKNINKNITIKCLTQSPQSCSKVRQEDHSEDNDYFDDDNETNLSLNNKQTESAEPYINTKKSLKQPNIDFPMTLQSSKTNNNLLPMSQREHYTNEEGSIKEQPNKNLLKLPPNVTAKSSNITKQVIEKSSQSIKNNCTQTFIKSKEINEAIEIFNIDDSDSDDSKELNKNKKSVDNQTNSYKSEICTVNPKQALKNLGKNITVKNMNQQFNKTSEAKLPKDNNSPQSDDSDSDLNDVPSFKEIKSHADLQTPENHKSLAIKHVLKNLGKNIIVKSRNSSPSQSVTSQDQNTQDSDFEKKNDSDSDSCSNNVKITEIENNHISDTENEQYNDTDYNIQCQNVIVQSPNDSCSENEDMPDKGDQSTDIENQLKLHKLVKSHQNITLSKNSTCLNSLRSINKDITIKSLNDNSKQKASTIAERNPEISNNLGNQLNVRPYKQAKLENQNNYTPTNRNQNVKQLTRSLNISSNSQSNPAASNNVNTINKEVTVKTFQTQTVIQEVTTTVTKTIRTVNHSVKQEVQSQSSTAPVVKPRIIQGIRPSFQPSQALGTTVRHITPPIGSKIRNAAPTIRPGAIVRPSKQIVSVRPGLTFRPTAPRMPVTPRPSTSGQQKPIIAKNLKISPHAVTTSVNKRPRSEEVSGHFSCFKKPKESLIPVSDVLTYSSNDANSITHLSSASHLSKSNITTTKIVKGNSVVTSTQMKSQVCTSSEQLNKLSNVSGLKIMKTCQVQQSEFKEKSERSATKQTTLDAIQKLQKQGLLVKKPRLGIDEESDLSNPQDENNEAHSSTEENDD